jgi:branched-chain amino acid transport system permease protein
MQLVIWVVTFIAMLALTLFIRYSRMGAPAAPVPKT